VNPYTKLGTTIRVRDEEGAWIPWLLLDVREVSFLIAPAEGRRTIKSRTMRITLHHVATAEGGGWLELGLVPMSQAERVRELAPPSARTRRVG